MTNININQNIYINYLEYVVISVIITLIIENIRVFINKNNWDTELFNLIVIIVNTFLIVYGIYLFSRIYRK